MAEKLENIFNECLDRVFQGESIESCLQRYPQEAAQLEPLLRTAFGFSWRTKAINPRPEFKARTRSQVRFYAANLHATQARQPQHTGLFTWQRAWAVALTAIMLLVFTGVGTAVASSSALPDQPLYQVKLATEDIQLAFAGSDVKKAEIHARLAENRALEIAAMARQGKTDQIVATTDRLIGHLDQAEASIIKVEQRTTTVASQPAATQPEATGAESAPAPALATAPTAPASTEAPTAPASTEAPTTPTEPSSVKSFESADAATGRSQEINKLNQTVTTSTSKSLETLEEAMDETPSQAKPALQQAIKTISEKKGKKLQSTTENQNEGKGKKQEQEQEQEQEQNSDQSKKQQNQESEVEQTQNGKQKNNSASEKEQASAQQSNKNQKMH